MTPRRQTGVFIVALVAMLAVAVALQVVRDRAFAHAAVDKQVLYVSNAEVMRRAALSYDTLLADVYWIRALQHYGGERQKPRSANAATICCIRCSIWRRRSIRASTIAYRFGAIFLAEPHPGGAGRPDQAIALLKKGIAFNPEQVGLLPRHRIHLLLAPPRLPECGRLVRPRRQSARRAVLAEDLRGRHADARRRSSGIAERCGRRSGRTRKATGCGERRSCGSRNSTRSIRSTC